MTHTPRTTPLDPLIASWLRSLRARNASGATIKTYETSIRQFARFTTNHGEVPGGYDSGDVTHTDLPDICRADVEKFLIHLYERGLSPATVNNRFRGIAQFFKWAEEEEEIKPNPMAKLKAPNVPETEVPLYTPEQIRQLLKSTEGKRFIDRRDNAILALFVDTGIRHAELAGVNVADLDLDQEIVRVMGKGGKPRSCPFGITTAKILDRYLRARRRQKGQHLDALWLDGHGNKALGYWGVGQMLERRGKAIGIDDLHPHRLRHVFSHEFLADGGSPDDLMKLNGWSTSQMTRRYGSAGAAARARKAGRDHSFMDRLQ